MLFGRNLLPKTQILYSRPILIDFSLMSQFSLSAEKLRRPVCLNLYSDLTPVFLTARPNLTKTRARIDPFPPSAVGFSTSSENPDL